jgi:hypothetical protein
MITEEERFLQLIIDLYAVKGIYNVFICICTAPSR